mmetsp:Transcript_24709/g.88292  ORF Transcript_24709/g.88292 Transcript_24709/m.88292 type:complete len:227 (-) Transcript_24709:1-681(-)
MSPISLLALVALGRRAVVGAACTQKCDYCVAGTQYFENGNVGSCPEEAPCPTAALTVGATETACGSRGAARVYTLAGGTFDGGGGNDYVDFMEAGSHFKGGVDHDSVGELAGGVFDGGPGGDRVYDMVGGTFNGGPGVDVVVELSVGTFDGGPGDDYVGEMPSGVFDGGSGNDRINIMLDGLFDGGPGNDRIDTMDGGEFEGGPGDNCVATQNGGTLIGVKSACST